MKSVQAMHTCNYVGTAKIQLYEGTTHIFSFETSHWKSITYTGKQFTSKSAWSQIPAIVVSSEIRKFHITEELQKLRLTSKYCARVEKKQNTPNDSMILNTDN